MITLVPSVQLAGVATLCASASCRLSITRQDLVEISPGVRRIGQHQPHPLIRIDDEHGADGDRRIGLRMHHAIRVGHLAVGAGEHGKIQCLALRFLDIALPARTAVDRIDRQADRPDVALVPFRLEAGYLGQFGGADRRIVPRVAEQNIP